MAQTNVTTTTLGKFPVIEEAPASNVFAGTIYTTVSKLLATMSTIIWILDLDATKHISGDRTRFPDLTDYEDFYHNASEE